MSTTAKRLERAAPKLKQEKREGYRCGQLVTVMQA